MARRKCSLGLSDGCGGAGVGFAGYVIDSHNVTVGVPVGVFDKVSVGDSDGIFVGRYF